MNKTLRVRLQVNPEKAAELAQRAEAIRLATQALEGIQEVVNGLAVVGKVVSAQVS